MAVNIDEVISTVTPEPEHPAGQSGSVGQPPWKMLADARDLHAALVRDRWRTAAEGFDD
jgi:hypothetical protein